jgi:hypothetical protein
MSEEKNGLLPSLVAVSNSPECLIRQSVQNVTLVNDTLKLPIPSVLYKRNSFIVLLQNHQNATL